MYYGKMGFTHDDLYNLPVNMRNFYYRKLSETRKKENEEHEREASKIRKK